MRKIFLLLSGLALVAGLALWRFWPAAPPAGTMTFVLAGHSLRFPADYVRMTDAPDPERVDLVALAPDFTPGAADPRRLPAPGEAGPKGRAQIFLSITPAPKSDGSADAASPAERYGPYLASEAQVTEGGLLRRRFEDSSPYAGEDLYLAPPDGEEFFARCERPKIPSDGLPVACTSEFRVENLQILARFDPVWLGEWSRLRANALLLVRGAMSPRQPK
ncbi:hypothetical protein K9U39_11675 [Rhodoblastus acidophilus]|uniref:Uncharacterized protein n=1 Tax=Candidatus Rhodoblastus alkanivorans TaxID=2954117 RepID=A0ABS9ZB54_9HYPH|nr:hypothetical protein [Candidatus Rhodoblastus alkanivorans]MCI4679987.1 hypothetical protein [Candidatus Rhodoblastus alkanivorans]MCI4684271.1 hypothetical protein [Candidatus Rhodoblastus alkanivorans]MDI4641591.1 hypothetical protein [Rhodoblastus acidophilus]